MIDFPATALTTTIWTYWICVGVMAVRIRHRTRKLSGIVPKQRQEQLMWLVWVPLVFAWMALPLLAAKRAPSWPLPAFVQETGYPTLRWIAAIVAAGCLALSIECWSRMGRNWRMAVAPDQPTDLVTGGLYSYVRHPIYAISILLMACSVVIVPTVPMTTIAVVHLLLMIAKARNEERFLHGAIPDAYGRYCRTTGRFLPRFGTRRRPREASP